MGKRHEKTYAGDKENRERMEKLYERIVGMIRQKFVAQNWPTPTRQPVRAEGKTKPAAKATRAS